MVMVVGYVSASAMDIFNRTGCSWSCYFRNVSRITIMKLSDYSLLIAQCVLIILKVCGVVTWSWWIVCIPLLLSIFVCIAFLCCFILFITVLNRFIKNNGERDNAAKRFTDVYTGKPGRN